jgi:hypothetical protein
MAIARASPVDSTAGAPTPQPPKLLDRLPLGCDAMPSAPRNVNYQPVITGGTDAPPRSTSSGSSDSECRHSQRRSSPLALSTVNTCLTRLASARSAAEG